MLLPVGLELVLHDVHPPLDTVAIPRVGLLLPELVPDGESWLAIAQPDGALVVVREGTDRTERDLARLRAELEGGLFDAPVRVRRSGFEPAEWPTGGAR